MRRDDVIFYPDTLHSRVLLWRGGGGGLGGNTFAIVSRGFNHCITTKAASKTCRCIN